MKDSREEGRWFLRGHVYTIDFLPLSDIYFLVLQKIRQFGQYFTVICSKIIKRS
jgi:hypothetical protein